MAVHDSNSRQAGIVLDLKVSLKFQGMEERKISLYKVLFKSRI